MFKVYAVVNHLDGLSLKKEYAQLEIRYDDEYFIIEEKGMKGFRTIIENTFKIPLRNMIDGVVTTTTELVEKDKSVVGRGVAGGLIFGPAGLILGGLSGVGSKKKKETKWVYIVSYLSSSEEIKNITFTMPSIMSDVTKKFDKKFKRHLEGIERSEGVKRIIDQPEQDEFIL